MPTPLPQEIRDRVLAAYDRGKQTKEIADTFGVSKAWARRVKQVRREENRTSRLPMGGVRVTKVDLAQLRELVGQQPDATTAELHRRLCGGPGKVRCSASAVGMALRRLGLTYKKRRCTPPSRTGRTSPSNAGSGGTGSTGGRPRA
jgi:transposase